MSRALLACLSAGLLPLALLLLLAPGAAAQDVFQEGTTITVELMNGDKLTGILLEADEPMLVIQHDVFGRMEIPRASIKPAAPAPVEPVTEWSGKFDLALSGSEGNTDNQNFRAGVDGKHETDEGIDTLSAWYTRATSDGDTDAEKLFSLYRHEWKLTDSKYRPFVQGSFESDKFTDYDARSAVAAGVAYPCIDGEVHKVTSRLGAGASYKSGVEDDDTERLNYEGLVGLDWLWKVSETHSFSLITDVYPSLNNTPEYRSVSRAAYEIKVDPASAWYIKLGVDHYYDSDPGEDSRSADYNYFVGLGRAF
jgi:putative salt-induced outer membrane protein YdiY